MPRRFTPAFLSKVRLTKALWGGLVIGLLVATALTQVISTSGDSASSAALPNASIHPEETLLRAFENQQEDFWVEASGQVTRLLPDDLEGSRHQRIIVALDSGQTLLIAHNIDIALRLAAVSVGDRLRFRGEYVWNARGGVIHWTHRDPDGSSAGGWLEWNGRRFR